MKRVAWDLAALRLKLAIVRLYLVIKAGFNPDQPRVPAGNPEGGQWTYGLGAGESTTLPATDIADERPPSRYAVILMEEELVGGHTIERHVAIPDVELLARIERETIHGFFVDDVPIRVGTFVSLESANDDVNRVLGSDPAKVDAVATEPWKTRYYSRDLAR